MSDGYDLEPHDDVVGAPVAAPSQPAANATWTLTDLRHGSSNWSLASDCGVRPSLFNSLLFTWISELSISLASPCLENCPFNLFESLGSRCSFLMPFMPNQCSFLMHIVAIELSPCLIYCFGP